MTVSQRIKHFYTYYLKVKPTDFARSIGMSKSVISAAENGHSQPSFRYIEAICEKYTELSVEWLVMERGEILRTNGGSPIAQQTSTQQSHQQLSHGVANNVSADNDRDMIQMLQRVINLLIEENDRLKSLLRTDSGILPLQEDQYLKERELDPPKS